MSSSVTRRESISGVAADAVEQRGREALADALVGADQVLGHDGRGRAVPGAHVLEGERCSARSPDDDRSRCRRGAAGRRSRAAAHRPSRSCRTRRAPRASAGAISISSRCTMVRFSGRVTGAKLKIGVVCLLRPSSARSAIALDIASGSGSSCNTIAIRSASATNARSSLILCFVRLSSMKRKISSADGLRQLSAIQLSADRSRPPFRMPPNLAGLRVVCRAEGFAGQPLVRRKSSNTPSPGPYQ